MKRLLATMACDFRLQFRNGFYYAAAFVALVWIILLNQIPDVNLGMILPALVLDNLLINTFYFIGGLVLLEKGEGTLEAQVVTPLRHSEYLVSKVLTLTTLSIVESLAIVILTFGFNFNVLPLIIGIALISAFFSLVGFIAVAGYDTINEYLLPSMLYVLVFLLPTLDYSGLVKSWLFYLHPVQAGLVFMLAAFKSVPTWQIVYGILYAGVWVVIAFLFCQRAFHRFVVLKQGVK
jgi:fluoroquinolone transport system permease protein